MFVRDAMNRNVPTIRIDKKLAAARSIMDWEAAQLMSEYQVTVLTVVEGTRIAGMISASDLVAHANG